MTTSNEINEIAGAMIALQAQVEDAGKNKTNPAFKSKYADLSAILEAVRPALKAAKLAVIQSPSAEGNVVSVTTRVIHASGQWIEGTISMTATRTDPQGIGSAITYGRRYSLAAMMGITQDDDDGNAASQPRHESPRIEPGYITPKNDENLKARASLLADQMNIDPEERKLLAKACGNDLGKIVAALDKRLADQMAGAA